MERTDKIGLEKPPYEETRWDLIYNRNWEKLDELHNKFPSLAEYLAGTTPVDVFIYDTTKDSGGGVWRETCQGLSWYKEDLNTNARGKTVKFPAVVAIVAEVGLVTLYDLTDSSSPMWMVFTAKAGGGSMVRQSVTSVEAKNGVLVVGSITPDVGLSIIDFNTDSAKLKLSGATQYRYTTDIAGRDNSPLEPYSDTGIVNNYVNSVAMSIVEGSDINPDSGVEYPTIRAGTDSGNSDICGTSGGDTVIDTDIGNKQVSVDITESGEFVSVRDDGTVNIWSSCPTVDAELPDTTLTDSSVPALLGTVKVGSNNNYGSSTGVSIVDGESVTQITNVINTGVMFGDIELCLTGEDLVDKCIKGVTVTDNGTAVFTRVATDAELRYTTATGGSITAPVPTGQVCYGWELVGGEWLFRRDISEFVGASESGGLLTIADGTSFTFLKYTSSSPADSDLGTIESLEKALFAEDTNCTIQGSSNDVTAVSYNPDDGELFAGTTVSATRFVGLVAYRQTLLYKDTNDAIIEIYNANYITASYIRNYLFHGTTNGSYINAEQSNSEERLIVLEGNKLDESDVLSLVETGTIPFPIFLPTKAITGNHTVDINSDYGLIIAAVTSDITITLPLLSSLTGRPYQILEFIPIVANGFKVRIACQGSDTFPFGNTWFDLPSSQKQFAIGLHPHGFNLRRNISVKGVYFRTVVWGSDDFQTPTAIPWSSEEKNTQDELIEWSSGDAGKIYVNTSGEYNISGGINADPQAFQGWQIDAYIYKNGSPVPFMSMVIGGDGNNSSSLFGASPIDLVAGDYIEMRLEHSGSADVNVTSAQFSIEIRL